MRVGLAFGIRLHGISITSLPKYLKSLCPRYQLDFPPRPNPAPANRVVHHDLEVVTSKVVECEADYKSQLAQYNSNASAHEEAAISDYVNSRVVFVIEPSNGDVGSKLEKVPLLRENRRRLFLYDSTLDGVLDWQSVKRKRLNVFCGSGLGIDKDRIESYFLDQVVKPVSEMVGKDCADMDVLTLFCKNDASRKVSHIDTMRSAVAGRFKKHVISVGTVESDTAECLQRYRRRQKRPFSATVEDKIVIVSLKFSDVHLGKMKYLAGGDTLFNRWPTPLLPISSMPSCTQAVQEKLAEPMSGRTEDDLGEEMDESTSILPDLPADHCIPYPHESHYLLGQELMHVFRTDVMIDASPGSGMKMLSVLLSNVRGVAICRNAAHKQLIMSNLASQVKARRLVPGFTALPKPPELVAYEKSTQGLGGTPLRPPAPKGSAPSPPPVPVPVPAPVPAPELSSGGSPAPSPSPGANVSPALNAFGSVVF
jgi:hypothetical protein